MFGYGRAHNTDPWEGKFPRVSFRNTGDDVSEYLCLQLWGESEETNELESGILLRVDLTRSPTRSHRGLRARDMGSKHWR
jgi:hypothetical protein